VTQRGGGRDNKLPPVWETTPETTGTAEIARDRGASIWLGISASRAMDLYAGYSRSTTYALNTVFFGVSVNVGSVLRDGIF
jgi:hypothetical protein